MQAIFCNVSQAVFNPKTGKCPKSLRLGGAIKCPDTTLSHWCITLKAGTMAGTHICRFNSRNKIICFILFSAFYPQEIIKNLVPSEVNLLHLNKQMARCPVSLIVKAQTTEPQRPWFGSQPGDLWCISSRSLSKFPASLCTDYQIKPKKIINVKILTYALFSSVDSSILRKSCL